MPYRLPPVLLVDFRRVEVLTRVPPSNKASAIVASRRRLEVRSRRKTSKFGRLTELPTSDDLQNFRRWTTYSCKAQL
eukprot:6172101-Pleurochrysis_carterae.AAC.1